MEFEKPPKLAQGERMYQPKGEPPRTKCPICPARPGEFCGSEERSGETFNFVHYARLIPLHAGPN